MNGEARDPIGDAIATVEEGERTVTMCEVPVTLASTARPVVLHVPVDMSDVEIIELAAFLLLHMRPWIAGQLNGANRLWIPPK